MKVLIVYAHPNPESFNHAVLEEFTRGLRDGGHSVEVVDLYGIGFDPRIKSEDLAQFRGGKMPDDVLEQQEKIKKADAMVFISPIIWGSLPGMLKGWMDRVFSAGFSHRPPRKGEVGPQGLLTHKKALIINTTMLPDPLYKNLGLETTIKTTFDNYILKTVGIQNVDHAFLHSVQLVPDEVRKGYLEKVYQLGNKF